MSLSDARWWRPTGWAVIAVMLTSAAALPPLKTPAWRSDWQAFVKELKPLLVRGAPPGDYQKVFEGKTVEWVGEVYLVDLVSELPGVQFKMPDAQVPMPDGTVFDVDGILRPWNLQRSEFKKWATVKPGDRVRFRTTLKERNSIFTVISLSFGVGSIPNEPKKFVSIAADGAELLEVVQRKQP